MDSISSFKIAANNFINLCMLKENVDPHSELTVKNFLLNLQNLWKQLNEIYKTSWISLLTQNKNRKPLEDIFDICRPLYYHLRARAADLLNLHSEMSNNLNTSTVQHSIDACKACRLADDLKKYDLPNFSITNVNDDSSPNCPSNSIANSQPATNHSDRDLKCENVLEEKSPQFLLTAENTIQPTNILETSERQEEKIIFAHFDSNDCHLNSFSASKSSPYPNRNIQVVADLSNRDINRDTAFSRKACINLSSGAQNVHFTWSKASNLPSNSVIDSKFAKYYSDRYVNCNNNAYENTKNNVLAIIRNLKPHEIVNFSETQKLEISSSVSLINSNICHLNHIPALRFSQHLLSNDKTATKGIYRDVNHIKNNLQPVTKNLAKPQNSMKFNSSYGIRFPTYSTSSNHLCSKQLSSQASALTASISSLPNRSNVGPKKAAASISFLHYLYKYRRIKGIDIIKGNAFKYIEPKPPWKLS